MIFNSILASSYLPDEGSYSKDKRIKYRTRMYILYIIFLCISPALFSQNYNSLRSRTLNVSSDTIRLDTLNIVPNTIKIYSDGTPVSSTLYSVDNVKGIIYFSPELYEKTIVVSYRVFGFNLERPYYHKDISLLDTNNRKRFLLNRPDKSQESISEIFRNQGIVSEGSISRGVMFGNNNDLSLESGLNLTLNGRLSNNLNIRASVADNNIPIQPEGTTQQIQDFENVYINIYNDNINMLAGDVDIAADNGYFLKASRKAKGGMISFASPLKKTGASVSGTAGIAVAKGMYNRMAVTPIEGNQGPYRMLGAQNEIYIVVLSGSEKVYVDGELLKRGYDNQYIIDYNTAEITFSPGMPITKDKRIIIEFEYIERSYSRYMICAGSKLTSEKGNLYFQMFTENDGNNPIENELITKNRSLLQSIGDSIEKAIVPNIDSTAFNNDMVMYKKLDTLVAGQQIPYYKYSNSADSAHYRLGFSYVGEGNGEYIPVVSTANGKVYEWKGRGNGSYMPVVKLITPKRQQMLTFGGNTLLKGFTTGFEVAASKYDPNAYSVIGNEDNEGYGMKYFIGRDFLLKDSNIIYSTQLDYRHTNKTFSFFERYLPVEFERDWNLDSRNTENNEHYIQFSNGFGVKDFIKSKYELEYLNLNNNYSASRHSGQMNLSFKNGFAWRSIGSLMNSRQSLSNTSFIRYKTTLSKAFNRLTLGVSNEAEDNTMTSFVPDSIMQGSFSFNQSTAFITNPDSSVDRYSLRYIFRSDRLPAAGELKRASEAQDIQAEYSLNRFKNNTIKGIFTYRNMDVLDTTLISGSGDDIITASLRNNFRTKDGLLSTSLFYQAATGYEPSLDYTYLEVASGYGTYTWIDYNNNNIKEKNEFEKAKFNDEAKYIRISLPSTVYRKTNTNRFNALVNVVPYKKWKDKTGTRKFISRFSEQFTYKTDNNVLRDGSIIVNPFYGDINSNRVLRVNSVVRNTVSFNKYSSRIFGVDYIVSGSRNKILLTDGHEAQDDFSQSIETTVRMFENVTLQNISSSGKKSYRSEIFSERDNNINYLNSRAVVNTQVTRHSQINVSYSISIKKNTHVSDIGEKANNHTVDAELLSNISGKASMRFKAAYINIAYNGEEKNSLAYEMLDGFGKGHNALWEMQVARTFKSGFELTAGYNGRMSQNQKIIHTGNMQARLNF